MELDTGICGLCSSEKEVVNPADSNSFWEKIHMIFGNDEENSIELKSSLKICTTCIFHATLIETNLEFFKSANILEEPVSHDCCKFCSKGSNMLIVNASSFRKKFIFGKTKGKGVKLPGTIPICTSCFYTMEASSIMKKNLSKMVDTKQNNINGEQNTYVEQISLLDDDDDDDAIEVTPLRHTSKRRRRDDKSSSSIEESSPTNSAPKRKRENSILPVESSITSSGEKHSKKPSLKVTLRGIKYNNEENNTPRTKRTRIFQVTSISDSLRDSIKKSNSYKSNLTTKFDTFDLSKILELSPLSKTNHHLDGAIMEDRKFSECIPFVKMTTYNKLEKISPDPVKTKEFSTSPLRRTLPIKIKLKPRKENIELKTRKDNSHKKIKKINTELKTKKENSKSKKGHRPEPLKNIVDKIATKEIVIKVARMKLPMEKMSSEVNSLSENSIIESETPNIENSENVTPKKKKKRVHFNDTPTIIITADELSEDLDSLEEDIPKKKKIRNKKIKDVDEKENGDIPQPERNVDDERNIELVPEEPPADNTGDTDRPEQDEENKQNGDESQVDEDMETDEPNEKEESEPVTTEESIDINSEKYDEEMENIAKKYVENEASGKESNQNEEKLFETEDVSEIEQQVEEKEQDSENTSEPDTTPEEQNRETEHNDDSNGDEVILLNDVDDCVEVLEGQVRTEDEDTSRTNEDNELPVDEVKGASENLEVETNADFGSLIDEMQKCLTSSNEVSLKDIALASTSPIEEMDHLEIRASLSPSKELVINEENYEEATENGIEKNVSDNDEHSQTETIGQNALNE